jgi:putative MATE family efflux protein
MHEAPAPFLLVEDPAPARGLAWLWPNRILCTQILRLAMPVVFGMVTQTAINLLDGAMVGHLPKEEANAGQAAIGLALPFMWLIGGCLSALWVGTQALVSRREGQGKSEEAGRVLTNSVTLALTSSVVISAAAYFATPFVIQALYGDDPMVARYGVQYLQARYVGVFAMVTTFSLKSFFDGIGRTYVFMVAAILMNVLNVVLNYIFIFGALGVRSYGVVGAAWASVISATVGLGVLALWTLRPNLVRRYRYFSWRNLDPKVAWRIVRLSLPNAGATIVGMLGLSAFYWVVGQVNALVSISGNPVVSTANQVVIMATMPSFMTSLAVGSATAAIVSQALGAGRPQLAQRYGLEAAKLWAYVMALLGALLFLFPDLVFSALSKDREVFDLARAPARVLALFHPIIAVAVVFAQTLYGAGDARFVMLVEICLHLLIMAPVAYLGGVVLGGGLMGVYAGPVLYASGLAVTMSFRYAQGRWKTIEV